MDTNTQLQSIVKFLNLHWVKILLQNAKVVFTKILRRPATEQYDDNKMWGFNGM